MDGSSNVYPTNRLQISTDLNFKFKSMLYLDNIYLRAVEAVACRARARAKWRNATLPGLMQTEPFGSSITSISAGIIC
jgi:hypothetical protein